MNYIAFMINYKISNVAEIAVILSIGLIRGEFRVIYAETTGAGDLNAAFRHLWTDRSPAWTGGFFGRLVPARHAEPVGTTQEGCADAAVACLTQ